MKDMEGVFLRSLYYRYGSSNRLKSAFVTLMGFREATTLEESQLGELRLR